MIFIAHRGNVNGIGQENAPEYVKKALRSGFDVEVDVWFVNGKYHLGHDKPDYPIELEEFEDYAKRIWWHAKNFGAAIDLNLRGAHVFINKTDEAVFTNKGYVWNFPLVFNSDGSLYGVCRDYEIWTAKIKL